MRSKSTHLGLYGCLLLVVIACGLPGTFARGGSCLALPFAFGLTCNSDTSIIGTPGHTITYSISVVGSTLLCCKAYFCKGSSCGLHDIGCGHGNWQTKPLNWGNILATPQIKCKGIPLGSAYTFTH